MNQQKIKMILSDVMLGVELQRVISDGYHIDFVVPIELANKDKGYIIIYE